MDPSNKYPEKVSPPPSYITDDTGGLFSDENLLTKDIDIKIRHGFIMKVFAILLMQLIVTGGFMALFMFYPPISEFLEKHFWVLYLSIALTWVMVILMACVPYLAKKYPINIIMLIIYTLIMSTLVGFVTCHYKAHVVLYALAATFGIFVTLVIFASQTKYDFTGWGPYILVATLVLLVFGVLAICIRSKALHFLYCAIGVLVSCIYIVYDTQLIVGGGKKHKCPIDAYVFASLSLYMDIINLFLYILGAMGGGSN